MDKNTLNGLLLMFLVFALFMWLTPKQENTPAQDGGKETKAEVAAATGIDSLTATEQEWLVQNISANGKVEVASDSSRIYTLRQGDIDLQLRGDSITGTVTVEGRKLAWSDVKRADLSKMSVPE